MFDRLQAYWFNGLAFGGKMGVLPSKAVSPLAYTSESWLSSAYMCQARANWRWLFMQPMPWAFCLACANAGKSMAARIAIIAMTTNNSINVKPPALAQRAKTRFSPEWTLVCFHCCLITRHQSE